MRRGQVLTAGPPPPYGPPPGPYPGVHDGVPLGDPQYPSYGPPPGYGPPLAYGPSAYGPYPYGYPPPLPGSSRPGLATAGAVLAFVLGGLLIIAGLLLFFGGSLAADLEDTFDSGTHLGTELTLDGCWNLLSAGLLIAGGVTVLSRRASGRVLLSVGGGLVLVASLYWLTRFTDAASGTVAFYGGLFLVLAVLVVTFVWVPPVGAWLRGGPPTPVTRR